MGHQRHTAIVVTSWHPDDVEFAHKKAVEIFGNMVTGIVPSPVNDQRTFMVGPDGSKLGWGTANEYSAKRAKYTEWLGGADFGDGPSRYVKWVYVSFGDDDSVNSPSKVIDSSDSPPAPPPASMRACCEFHRSGGNRTLWCGDARIDQ